MARPGMSKCNGRMSGDGDEASLHQQRRAVAEAAVVVVRQCPPL